MRSVLAVAIAGMRVRERPIGAGRGVHSTAINRGPQGVFLVAGRGYAGWAPHVAPAPQRPIVERYSFVLTP